MLLKDTDFIKLPAFIKGKVRDVYEVGEDKLLIVVTDRISAFDVVFPDLIPNKGKVLNSISEFWFNYTKGFRDMEKQQGDMEEGDVISFCARVKRYEKGYCGRRFDIYKPIETDYKLSHPTKIQKAKTIEDSEQKNTLTAE